MTTGERTNLPLTVQALILQPDGKIVVGGRSADDDFALMRLNSNGTTDSGFGGADGVVNDLGGVDAVTALALDGDGKIVAAGFGNGPSSASHTIVRRYNADGTRDMDFQATDRAFGLDDAPAAIVMRPDGKIVVAGNSKVGTDNDVLLLRFEPDGTRDDTFGIGGISLQDAGSYPVVGDAVVRPDGRAVVAGSLRVTGRPRLALLRYQGDTSTAVRPAQGFVVDRHRSAVRLLGRVLGQAGDRRREHQVAGQGSRARRRAPHRWARARGRRHRRDLPLPVR